MKWYLTPIVIFAALMVALGLYFGAVILIMKLVLGSSSTQTGLENVLPIYLYIVIGFAGVVMFIAIIDSLFFQRKIKA